MGEASKVAQQDICGPLPHTGSLIHFDPHQTGSKHTPPPPNN